MNRPPLCADNNASHDDAGCSNVTCVSSHSSSSIRDAGRCLHHPASPSSSHRRDAGIRINHNDADAEVLSRRSERSSTHLLPQHQQPHHHQQRWLRSDSSISNSHGHVTPPPAATSRAGPSVVADHHVNHSTLQCADTDTEPHTSSLTSADCDDWPVSSAVSDPDGHTDQQDGQDDGSASLMSHDALESVYGDLHQVTLQKMPGLSLGFSIRGGIETDTGIFVTSVDHGSQAEDQGLKLGDRILKVNNVNLCEVTHAEAVRAIQSSAKLRLSVTSTEGYKMPGRTGVIQVNDSTELRTVNVLADNDGYLGLSFIGGSDMGSDVVICNVEPNSPAERAGLIKGQIIIKLNGENVKRASHMEIARMFSSSREIELVVKTGESAARKSLREQVDAKLLSKLLSSYNMTTPVTSATTGSAPGIRSWQCDQDYGIPMRTNRKLLAHMRRDSSLSSDMDTSNSSECDSNLDGGSGKPITGILKFHLDKHLHQRILSRVNEISFTDAEDEEDEEIPITIIDRVDPAEFGFEPFDFECVNLDTEDCEILDNANVSLLSHSVRDIAKMFELKSKRKDPQSRGYAHRWKNLKDNSRSSGLIVTKDSNVFPKVSKPKMSISTPVVQQKTNVSHVIDQSRDTSNGQITKETKEIAVDEIKSSIVSNFVHLYNNIHSSRSKPSMTQQKAGKRTENQSETRSNLLRRSGMLQRFDTDHSESQRNFHKDSSMVASQTQRKTFLQPSISFRKTDLHF